jgi:hypothetical protein
MDREPLPIRSYRVCFDLERRIYRLEQWRLPVPWGIPLRGVAYAAVVLLGVLIARNLPLLGALVDGLPAPVRFLILPVGVAYLLTSVRIDGRPLHTAAGALARHVGAPAWVAGFRRCPPVGAVERLGEVTIAPDEKAPRMRRGRIEGPCALLLRYPARGHRRGRRLVVEQSASEPMWRGKTVRLGERQRLDVRRSRVAAGSDGASSEPASYDEGGVGVGA